MTAIKLTSQVLEQLGRYDTPTICNAVELFGLRRQDTGYMNNRIKSLFPDLPPVVAYATTATMRCAAPRSKFDPTGSLEEQIERFSEIPSPPIVVFQDLDDPPLSATFGEVMCATYHRFGAVGIITNGAARDVDAIRQYDFAVFAPGTICAHGYTHVRSINTTVRVGGLIVQPGDLLHGDSNGVVSIPLEIASEVPEVAAEYVEAEGLVFDFLKSDVSNVKLLREVRKEMFRRLEDLEQRLRIRKGNSNKQG